MNLTNRVKKAIVIGSILALPFMFTNKTFSQGREALESGAEIGIIRSQNANGVKLGFSLGNSKMKIRYVVESTYPKGVEFLNAGFEFDYFPNLPTKRQIFKPYVGSGIKAGTLAYFTDGKEKYTRVHGIGIGAKVGIELQLIKKGALGRFEGHFSPYIEAVQKFSFNKKSANYPTNSQVKGDNFSIVLGVRF